MQIQRAYYFENTSVDATVIKKKKNLNIQD